MKENLTFTCRLGFKNELLGNGEIKYNSVSFHSSSVSSLVVFFLVVCVCWGGGCFYLFVCHTWL